MFREYANLVQLSIVEIDCSKACTIAANLFSLWKNLLQRPGFGELEYLVDAAELLAPAPGPREYGKKRIWKERERAPGLDHHNCNRNMRRKMQQKYERIA